MDSFRRISSALPVLIDKPTFFLDMLGLIEQLDPLMYFKRTLVYRQNGHSRVMSKKCVTRRLGVQAYLISMFA